MYGYCFYLFYDFNLPVTVFTVVTVMSRRTRNLDCGILSRLFFGITTFLH